MVVSADGPEICFTESVIFRVIFLRIRTHVYYFCFDNQTVYIHMYILVRWTMTVVYYNKSIILPFRVIIVFFGSAGGRDVC